jgi:hypothetical protein
MTVSLKPQLVGKSWYYEKKCAIEVYVPSDAPVSVGGDTRIVRISKKKLQASLRRMRKR